MNESRLIFLYRQYIDDLSSDEELQELESMLSDPKNEFIFMSLLDGSWEEFSAHGLKNLSENKSDLIYNKIIRNYKPKKHTIKLWLRVAAALFLSLSIGLIIYSTNKPKLVTVAEKPGKTSSGEILPGGNKAILTLANGKSVILDDANSGKIASQQGVEISKLKDGQLVYTSAGTNKDATTDKEMNTITIPKGGQYHLTLPDGTRIFLNSASSLSYPTAFTGAERVVILQGEAYFEVAKVLVKSKSTGFKEQRMPFIVKTADQQVEVLGTHFNINAYAGEASTTTLLEGSVKVSPSGAIHHSSLLKPGQQSVLKEREIRVSPADIEDVMAWKNGLFVFNNENITSVMKKISRWYDVDVIFKGDMTNINFLGNYSRGKSLDNLLKNIELMEEVTFHIEGRRITVSRK